MSDFRRFCIGYAAAASVFGAAFFFIDHASFLDLAAQLIISLHVGAITVAVFGKRPA